MWPGMWFRDQGALVLRLRALHAKSACRVLGTLGQIWTMRC